MSELLGQNRGVEETKESVDFSDERFSEEVISPGYRSEAYPDGFGLVRRYQPVKGVSAYPSFDQYWQHHFVDVLMTARRYGAVFYAGLWPDHAAEVSFWIELSDGLVRNQGDNKEGFYRDSLDNADLHFDSHSGLLMIGSDRPEGQGRKIATELVLVESTNAEVAKEVNGILEKDVGLRTKSELEFWGRVGDGMGMSFRSFGMALRHEQVMLSVFKNLESRPGYGDLGLNREGGINEAVNSVVLDVWERIKASGGYLYIDWENWGPGVLVVDETQKRVLHRRELVILDVPEDEYFDEWAGRTLWRQGVMVGKRAEGKRPLVMGMEDSEEF